MRKIRVLQSLKESPGEKFAEALKVGKLFMLNDGKQESKVDSRRPVSTKSM